MSLVSLIAEANLKIKIIVKPTVHPEFCQLFNAGIGKKLLKVAGICKNR
jgi:hypothetical protein